MTTRTLSRADLTAMAQGEPDTTSVAHWVAHKTDQPVCWCVLRLMSCKIWWLRHEGLEGPQWTRKLTEAQAFGDRESTYALCRRVQGLLYLYDRSESSSR